MRRRKRLFLFLTVVAILLIAAWTGRRQVLTSVAGFLVINDRPAQADVIFLLNGSPQHRPFLAARLLQEGYAPKIVIARAEEGPTVALGLTRNSTDVSIGVLTSQGVAEDRIVQLRMPGGATSTYDEARLLRDYCGQHPVKKVLLVTSSFHARRSKWIFERVLRDKSVSILTSSIDDARYSASNWWTREAGFLDCQNEYLKLLYYLLNH